MIFTSITHALLVYLVKLSTVFKTLEKRYGRFAQKTFVISKFVIDTIN